MRARMLAVALLAGNLSVMAGDKAPDTALAHSVEQLRGSIGRRDVMTGPLGGEVRTSQEYATTDGGKGRLRFTRFNVTPDSFESRMEYTEDGGKSRKPGNRQKFRRVSSGAS